MYLLERIIEKARTLQMMIHSSNGCGDQGWARQSQEPRVFWVLQWVRGPNSKQDNKNNNNKKCKTK